MFLQCTLYLSRVLALLVLATVPCYAWAETLALAADGQPSAPVLDPYTIKGVAASATAKDAVQARDQALANAQRQAFATMVKRLNRPDVQADKFNDQAIAGIVKSFSIDSERAAATAYRALVTVTFNQSKVAALLGGTGALAGVNMPVAGGSVDTAFTGAKPRLLLLPILVVGQRRVLWDEPNPWLKAWQKLGSVQGARAQFRVPVGDMDDIKTLPENALAAGRFDNVTPMLMRYAADRMVVAQLTSQGAPTLANAGLNMQLYELRDNQFVPLAEQNVIASGGYQFADAVPVAVNLAEQALAGNAPVIVNKPTVVSAPVVSTVNGQTNGLPVMVRYDNLATWLRIQGQLKQMPQVYAVNVRQMSATEAKLNIGLKGDLPSFETALSEHGWALRLLGEGQYQLTKLGRTL